MTPVRPINRIAWRSLATDRARSTLVALLVAFAVVALLRTASTSTGDGVGLLVLGLALLVEVSALAIGDRDRLRSLALLDVNGASPRTQRLVCIVQGAMLGVLGTAVGSVVGVAVRLAAPVPFWPLRPRDVVGVACIGVGASIAAAVVAAMRSDAVPTITGAVGRRPSAPPRRRRLALGLGLCVVGTHIAAAVRSFSDMAISVSVGGSCSPSVACWWRRS